MRALREKAGISLIFVLAAMFFLLALGVATLSAAGLSRGASLSQRELAQLNLYVNSMERVALAALRDGIGEQVIREIVNDVLGDLPEDVLFWNATETHPIELEIEVDTPFGAEFNIRITGEATVTTFIFEELIANVTIDVLLTITLGVEYEGLVTNVRLTFSRLEWVYDMLNAEFSQGEAWEVSGREVVSGN